MTGESNKGRFKCPHEAQAVWNAFKEQNVNFTNVKNFQTDVKNGVLAFESFAKSLHKARLIHGTIYDEDGRIENKDVAHEEYLEGVFDVNIFSSNEPCKYGDDPRIFNEFIFSGQNTQVRGTIFY